MIKADVKNTSCCDVLFQTSVFSLILWFRKCISHQQSKYFLQWHFFLENWSNSVSYFIH